MRQLTGLDATWIHLETENSPLHIGVLNVFEVPDDPDFSPFEASRAQFGSRVPSIDPLRRRLVEVPFGLGRPYWVMDGELDLDAHIHHHVLAEPTDDALAQLASEIMSEPLDRNRPLWAAHVIEGLSDNRWVLLSKYHHAAIDGGAGILLAHLLFDADPDARAEIPDTLVPDAEPMPSDVDLISKSAASLMSNPAKLVKFQVKAAKHLASQVRADGIGPTTQITGSAIKSLLKGEPTGDVEFPTRMAPPTPWNISISAERRVAFRSLPMADILALKTALNGTVNDAVMTACAGGLRRYLEHHDALPDEPLRGLVPVSRRTGEETEPWRNLITIIQPSIPTNEPDPMVRLERIQQTMKKSRASLDLAPADALEDLADLAPAAIMTTATQLAARLKLGDHIRTSGNLTISNVAGPRTPLYLAGAKLLHLTPISLLTDGVGLNITVLSCGDRLDIGLTSCAVAVPDLSFMLQCILDEIDDLFELTGAERS